MPTPPLSDADKRATVDALKKSGGRVTLAASLLGIAYGTISTRKLALLADPKWRGKVTAVPGTPAGLTADPTVHRRDVVADARGEAEKQRKRAEHAEAMLDAHRRIKPIVVKRAKIGKEDWVRIIRPDYHGRNHCPAARSAYLTVCRELRPDQKVGLGDLIDCGAFLAAHHVMGYVDDTAYSVADDYAEGGSFLDAEQEACGGAEEFEIEGNHDHRPEQWCITQAQRNGGDVRKDAEFLMSRFSPEHVFNYKRRGIKYVKRGEFYDGLPVPGTLRLGRCLFTHGNFVGKDCVHKALAAYGTNVVFGHTHRMLEAVVPTVAAGTIGAWTCGFLAKTQPYWHHAKPSGWTQGFGVQFVAKSGAFQHVNVVIHEGNALLFGRPVRGK